MTSTRVPPTVLVLRLTASSILLLGVLGLALGAAAAIDDLRTDYDEWDGLGLLIGAGLAAIGAVLLLLGTLTLTLARRHAVGVGITFAVLGLLAALVSVAWFHVFGSLLVVPVLVVGLLLVSAGLPAAFGAGTVRIDSLRGN